MKNYYISFVLSLLVVCSFQRAYDANIAHELQRASSSSYCQTNALKSMKCDTCTGLPGYVFNHQFTSTISSVESVSYSIFVNTAKHRIIFAFRGSVNLIQIGLEGAQGNPVKYDLHNLPNARATGYFYTKYKNNLRSDFFNRLKDLVRRHPDYSFYFTGHSLGGALATLGALDVSLSNILDKSRIHLYTFGAPRPGDYNLAQAVNARVGEHYRIVHSRDPVPHLPPCSSDGKGGCAATSNPLKFLVWNAYHPGTEVFYDSTNEKQYKICPKAEDPTCSKKYNLLNFNKDHHTRYLGMSTQCHAK